MEVIHIKTGTRIRARVGEVTRIIRANSTMDGGTTITVCHHFKQASLHLRKKVDLEEALAHMMTSHSTFMNETKATFQNQAQQLQNQSTQLQNQGAQLRNLEVQIGQMATLLTERQHGSLLSNSEVNPRREGNEHVKAVTLRSGRE